MPLVTSITDQDGTLRKMPNGWGWWHVERMAEVIVAERNLDPATPILEVLSVCPYTVRAEHTFTDRSDGEVFVLTPGVVLNAWREVGGR